MTKIDKNAER